MSVNLKLSDLTFQLTDDQTNTLVNSVLAERAASDGEGLNEKQIEEQIQAENERKERNRKRLIIVLRIITFSIIATIGITLFIIIKKFSFKYTEDRLDFTVHHILTAVAVITTLLNTMHSIQIPFFQEIFFLN